MNRSYSKIRHIQEVNQKLEKMLMEQSTPSTTPLSREEQIRLNKEKIEQKRKAAEEARLKSIQKKDSIAKAWDEKRAPELKKAEEIHKKYLQDWLSKNPGKTEKDYQEYLKKQNKKPDIPACNTQDPNFDSTKCGTSKEASKQSKKDWKSK
jgi:hypothetical protein